MKTAPGSGDNFLSMPAEFSQPAIMKAVARPSAKLPSGVTSVTDNKSLWTDSPVLTSKK